MKLRKYGTSGRVKSLKNAYFAELSTALLVCGFVGGCVEELYWARQVPQKFLVR